MQSKQSNIELVPFFILGATPLVYAVVTLMGGIQIEVWEFIGGAFLSAAVLIAGLIYIIDLRRRSVVPTMEDAKGDQENAELKIQQLEAMLRDLQEELEELEKLREEVTSNASCLEGGSPVMERSLFLKFLLKQRFEDVCNILFPELSEEGEITEAKSRGEGYSGARVYEIYRGKPIPKILKIDTLDEVKNEVKKFKKFVDGWLLLGPVSCNLYQWKPYGGLEYSLKWAIDDADHLSFQDVYRGCLHENREELIRIETISEGVIERLFRELQGRRSWWSRTSPIPPKTELQINIFEEHYPIIRKFVDIREWTKNSFKLGKAYSSLRTFPWKDYEQNLYNTFLAQNWWDDERRDRENEHAIIRAILHGDLNSRNILLEAKKRDHNTIFTLGLVDFSHTGNGLTIQTTQKFNKLNINEEQGHIALDFCRLEADIKFYLTDLDDEQDLQRAWLLEVLLLENGLKTIQTGEFPDWETLREENRFQSILEKENLVDKLEWKALADPDFWTEQHAKKFKLMWESVRSIRKAYVDLFNEVTGGGIVLYEAPFNLALIQAGLTTIYWEDERFYNPELQKLYLVLASAMLVEKLGVKH